MQMHKTTQRCCCCSVPRFVFTTLTPRPRPLVTSRSWSPLEMIQVWLVNNHNYNHSIVRRWWVEDVIHGDIFMGIELQRQEVTSWNWNPLSVLGTILECFFFVFLRQVPPVRSTMDHTNDRTQISWEVIEHTSHSRRCSRHLELQFSCICENAPDVECAATCQTMALPEILQRVFLYLDVQSLGRAAQVSTMWRDQVGQRQVWNDVTVCLGNYERQFNQFKIAPVNPSEYRNMIDPSADYQPSSLSFPNLSNMVICYNCPLTDRTISLIVQRFPNLVWLKLSCINRFEMSDVSMTLIVGGLKLLRRLDLSGLGVITDMGLASLSGWNGVASDGNVPALHSLSLKFIQNLTDDGLKFLSIGQTALQSLNLCNCSATTNRGIEFVSRLTDLRVLNLSFCSRISDAGMVHLKRLKRLTELEVNSPLITARSLDFLASDDSQLTSLTLLRCRQVNDGWGPSLARLAHLTKLCLTSTQIGDSVVQCLADGAGALSIETLILQECRNLTDEAGCHLARMKNLRVVDISRSCIGDAGLGHMADAVDSKIEELWLSKHERLTQASFTQVIRLPCLRKLNLCKCTFFHEWTLVNQKFVVTFDSMC